MTGSDRQLEALLLVAAALERLDVDYAVCGSLASSVYGEFRATQDVDIVARLRPFHAVPLLRALTPAFYIPDDAVQDAIRRGRSFNAIHTEWAEKIDVFVPPDSRWTEYQLRRRELKVLNPATGGSAYFVSAEDVVLAKLDWFRRGGEVSGQQWRDVQGVLRLRGEELHRDYMDERAAELGVSDLLVRARTEAGLGG